MTITSWPQFARRIRPGRTDLLRELPRYPNSILVAGCQRSGGTMLAAAFTEHPDVVDFSWGKDAELDAALTLSGTQAPETTLPVGKRFCFQTTYLNERGIEYPTHAEHFHLIWLIRNPHSVIYSMLYNWKRFALNEVFLACGAELLPAAERARLQRWGLFGVRPIKRACYAYLGKLQQGNWLMETLPDDRMMTLRYEDLVTHKAAMMKSLGDFVGLAPAEAGEKISTRSMKKAQGLGTRERRIVDELCGPGYERAMAESIRLQP
ncbi:MAG: sulfotransferase domain-containing protein [Pseudomonadota bacterium]